ncbi:BadF/BadG/BcrA/BcrD ATPase family protein [Psychromarinibacter sp. S121]|uniref:BadF/BadG/BcrA/BcrD ATPase family protein n=1 Tax=Psychromarinibacter sp. S121 TaxID=3415127 RepID=UPI003C79B8A4
MTRTDTYVVGVDGGATGCRVAIARTDGTVVAGAEGAEANVASDFDKALKHLSEAIETARAKAGIDARTLAASPAWFGLAGAIDAATCDRVAAALPFDTVRVTDDRPTGMTGALGGRDGCLVATGTGSFLGRQAGTERFFVGGWGLQLSDQASGAWLARNLLRALVDHHDNMGPDSALLQDVLAEFGTVAAAVFFSLRATPTEFARLAPRIVAAAKDGDPVARRLMQEGADWVAEGLNAMGASDAEAVCLIGGIGPHYADYLPPALTRNLLEPRGTSLDGAVLLARELAAG